MIQILPDFKSAFDNSAYLSSKCNFFFKLIYFYYFNWNFLTDQKGTSFGLLKTNVQRRRKKEQIENEKIQAIFKQNEIEQKMA